MSVPLFDVVPNSITAPETFNTDMDDLLGNLNPFIQALNDAGTAYGLSLSGTSTTSVAIATGSKSLTTQTGLGWKPGYNIFIASTASPTNRMIGTVTSYTTGTGALVVSVSAVGGSGTFAAWSIGPAAFVSLNNQTFDNPTFTGKITEEVYSLVGNGIDPTNGTIQVKTLTANTTFTATIYDGQSVTLMIADGAGYTATWPTIRWIGLSAPTLSLSRYTTIGIWKAAGEIFGVLIGEA